MKLTEIRIRNFRSLVDVTLPLADTTVLVGENNVGKTAVLEAVRHVLSRAGTRRTAPFDEYDYHLATDDADPRKSEGIIIDALFAESEEGEWPADLRDELSSVVQVDPETGTRDIRLRLSARFDADARSFVPSVEFLGHDAEALKLNHAAELTKLLRYVPLFRLSALRDPGTELHGRSQFWRPLLKSLDLPEEQVEAIRQRMNELNQRLLELDPRLSEVTKTLDRAGDVVSAGTGDRVQVRALPLTAWDLLARADITLRGKGSDVAFPLLRHGQGLQSLAVLFLFEAFVNHLLAETFERDSEPLLTLEEPEAHLHPQAARALWRQVKRLPGQQLITTHSPYFAQLVPLRDLRVLRRRGPATTIHWLPETADVELPWSPDLDTELMALAEAQPDLYAYQRGSEHRPAVLRAKRALAEEERNELFAVGELSPDHEELLRELSDRAAVLLSDDDLHDIERYVRRTRGEILFARCWLLCEGQSELIVLPRFAEMLDIQLDERGISLIDYQNNGSPGAFAALARALDIPWLMLCDDDRGGRAHIAQLERRVPQEVINERVTRLPGTDLEGYLSEHFHDELSHIAAALSTKSPTKGDELPANLRKHKTKAARRLAEALAGQPADRVPKEIEALLTRCKEQADA